jgi:hypothetical protein
MQGQVMLDEDAGFGAGAQPTAPTPAPQPQAEATPQAGKGQEQAANAGLDDDAGYSVEQPQEPEAPAEEDWSGFHGGRINSKEEADRYIRKQDQARVQAQKERDEIRKELAELRAHNRELSQNALKIAANQQRPAAAPQQPQRPQNIITEEQLEKAFAEGNIRVVRAFVAQEAAAQTRMMANHLSRQYEAKLEPLKKELEGKGKAMDELVNSREGTVWDAAEAEANKYLNERLPQDLDPEVRDALYNRITELGSDDDTIVKFMELTPAGHTRRVNLTGLVNMALGEFAHLIYAPGGGRQAPAPDMVAARRNQKAVLTSAMAPGKRPPMPSETRTTKAQKDEDDMKRLLISSPSRRW